MDQHEENVQDKEYDVEDIINKKMNGDKVEYLLKWKGYDDCESTWVKSEDMNCPELIRKYEENLRMRKTGKGERKIKGSEISKAIPHGAMKTKEKCSQKFDHDCEPEKILGASVYKNGELEFLILWKGSRGAQMVSSKEANEKWPKFVIQFYEERLHFNNENACDNGDKNVIRIKTEGVPIQEYAEREFDSGLKPDRILGMSKVGKELWFLMKWKNNEGSFISSKAASVICPQLVIKFYESRLSFPTK